VIHSTAETSDIVVTDRGYQGPVALINRDSHEILQRVMSTYLATMHEAARVRKEWVHTPKGYSCAKCGRKMVMLAPGGPVQLIKMLQRLGWTQYDHFVFCTRCPQDRAHLISIFDRESQKLRDRVEMWR
jgi:hypothetical protein